MSESSLPRPIIQTRGEGERPCDYSSGQWKLCLKLATYERHRRMPHVVQQREVRVTKEVRVTFACDQHRYPSYQTTDTPNLWTVAR